MNLALHQYQSAIHKYYKCRASDPTTVSV